MADAIHLVGGDQPVFQGRTGNEALGHPAGGAGGGNETLQLLAFGHPNEQGAKHQAGTGRGKGLKLGDNAKPPSD